jgi:predicted lipoprotein with Yx(FWY)xxD motif
MKKFGTLAFAAALTLTLAGCYSAPTASGQTPPSPVSEQNGMLVGANGMTLYTFDKDTAGDTTGDGVMGVWHTARP